MNSRFKLAAIAAFAAAFAAPVMADNAETKGGLTVKTDDGRFEMKIGGRIHFDTYMAVEEDDLDQTSTTNFRRARLTMEGKAYGWNYKFENDFTGKAEGGGFREMWLGTKLADQNLRIGQAKPYRGMEELTSSNEIVFMERPFATATGIYAGNQFGQGLFVDGHGSNWNYGIAGYSLRNEEKAPTEGVGAAARFVFAPVLSETAVLHIGASASTDRPSDAGIATREAEVRPFGRISSNTSADKSISSGKVKIASTPEDRTSYGLELAGKAGPFYAQGEWATMDYKNDAAKDETVDAWYVQTSFLLTGETKPYDIKKGVFKSPKPANSYGAWELKARYDVIEGEGTPNDEVTNWIAGVNWYVNPNVRFMFEYLSGAVEVGTTDVDVDVFQVRSQFSF